VSDVVAPKNAYGVLRHRFVRSFAAGRFAAVCGTQIIATTVSWQLYQRTHEPLSLGLVGLVELLPVVCLVIPAGHAIDRYPRKYVATASYLAIIVVAALLALLTATHAPVESIYAVLVLLGAARAFAAPSTGTILPQLLDPSEIAQSSVWMSATFQLAAAIGPALGGGLIAIASDDPLPAYLISAGLVAVFIVVLWRMPTVQPPASARGKRRMRELFAGFGFIRKNPVFLSAITLDMFAVLFGGAVALLPVFAEDILHVDAAGYGWLRAAPAVGALTCALAISLARPWARPGVTLLWTVIGFGASSVAFGLSTSFALSFCLLLLVGAFDEVSVIIRSTLEQVITPDGLRGRVSSINYVFIGFSNELGAFESGFAASLIGPVAAVVAGGIATFAVVGVVAARWPQLRQIGPLHTLVPPAEPEARPEAP